MEPPRLRGRAADGHACWASPGPLVHSDAYGACRWFGCEIRPRYEALVEALEIVTAMSKCHNERCGAWFSFWWLGGVQLQTRCGQIGTVSFGSRYPTWVRDPTRGGLPDGGAEGVGCELVHLRRSTGRAYSKTTNTSYTAQALPPLGWHLGAMGSSSRSTATGLVRGPRAADPDSARSQGDRCRARVRRRREGTVLTASGGGSLRTLGAERVRRRGLVQHVRHGGGTDRRRASPSEPARCVDVRFEVVDVDLDVVVGEDVGVAHFVAAAGPAVEIREPLGELVGAGVVVARGVVVRDDGLGATRSAWSLR